MVLKYVQVSGQVCELDLAQALCVCVCVCDKQQSQGGGLGTSIGLAPVKLTFFIMGVV